MSARRIAGLFAVGLGVLGATFVGLALSSNDAGARRPKTSPSSRGSASASVSPPQRGMVRMARGTFQMGDQAVHTETVASFDLDRNEVTVAAYKACWSAGRCTLPDTPGLCNWGRDDRGDHPINCVDWYQARGYCEWLGKRLPTETEWEYAAKGSQGRKYAWGDSEPGGQLCWKRGNARLGTCAVASYLQGNTPQGLRDMGGNVWEWTSSEACPIPQKACGAAARVFRGGGWGNDDAGYVRATSRGVDLPTSRLDFVGFRCARARP